MTSSTLRELAVRCARLSRSCSAYRVAKRTRRLPFGTACAKSSTRLASISAASKAIPVTFPPARARLATRPAPTGSSPAKAMTTGVEGAASFAAWAAGVDTARITSACVDQKVRAFCEVKAGECGGDGLEQTNAGIDGESGGEKTKPVNPARLRQL